jgi:outer membrane immunogenic protein
MKSRCCFNWCVVIAFVASVSVAHADEVPAEADQLSRTQVDWSGLFVGPQAGCATANTGWTFPIDSYFTLPDSNRSFHPDPVGCFVGGHIAWNRQIGALVIGGEFTLNRTSVDETRYGAFASIFPDDRFETSIDRYGTLTARLGYALERTMFYAVAGYARGNAEYRAISGPPGSGVVGEVEDQVDGWTAGGGLEYQLDDNISIGLQYDFVRFNGNTHSISTTGTPSSDPFVLKTHDIGVHSVAVRLSIKLDP